MPRTRTDDEWAEFKATYQTLTSSGNSDEDANLHAWLDRHVETERRQREEFDYDAREVRQAIVYTRRDMWIVVDLLRRMTKRANATNTRLSIIIALLVVVVLSLWFR